MPHPQQPPPPPHHGGAGGGQEDHEGGAGYSGPLLQRGQDVLDDYERSTSLIDGKAHIAHAPDPAVRFEQGWAWGPAGVNQSSRNHEANAWTVECARAALGGTPEQFAAARKVLLDAYYPRELGAFESTEMLVPDAHTHQYTSAYGMERVAAWMSKDPELLERSLEHLCIASVIFTALASPAPNFFMGSPGMRSPGKPSWYAGTAWLRLLKGNPVPMPEFSPQHGEGPWKDRTALGLRALRYLMSVKDPGLDEVQQATLQTWLPKAKMKYQLTVYRGRDRHLAVIDQPKGKAPQNVCDWVLVPWLDTYQATAAQMQFGLNWQTPPPAPPPGAQVIHFPLG